MSINFSRRQPRPKGRDAPNPTEDSTPTRAGAAETDSTAPVQTSPKQKVRAWLLSHLPRSRAKGGEEAAGAGAPDAKGGGGFIGGVALARRLQQDRAAAAQEGDVGRSAPTAPGDGNDGSERADDGKRKEKLKGKGKGKGKEKKKRLSWIAGRGGGSTTTITTTSSATDFSPTTGVGATQTEGSMMRGAGGDGDGDGGGKADDKQGGESSSRNTGAGRVHSPEGELRLSRSGGASLSDGNGNGVGVENGKAEVGSLSGDSASGTSITSSGDEPFVEARSGLEGSSTAPSPTPTPTPQTLPRRVVLPTVATTGRASPARGSRFSEILE